MDTTWVIAVLTTAATSAATGAVAWWYGRRAETHRRLLDMKAQAYCELIDAWLAVLLEMRQQMAAGGAPELSACPSVPRMTAARLRVGLFGNAAALDVLARAQFTGQSLVDLANVVRHEFGTGRHETRALASALGATLDGPTLVVGSRPPE